MAIYVYSSNQQSAPRLSGTVGDLTTLLDQCLVNGYTTGITWNGAGNLTQTGNVATFVGSGVHGFLANDWIKVTGATQTDYNVTAKVITVISPTSFTYAIANNPASPATTGSTITAYRAGAGFTIDKTGTNIRTYKAGSGLQHVLGVDDTSTFTARIRCGESATAAGTAAASFTNPCPSDVQLSGGFYAPKSISADTTSRPWILVTNGKTIHFCMWSNATSGAGWQFGEFVTKVAGTDVWYTFITGTVTNSANPSATASGITQIAPFLNTTLTTASSTCYVLRSYTQTGTSTLAGKIISGHFTNSISSTYPNAPGNYMAIQGQQGHLFPAMAEGGMITSPFWIIEQGCVRGIVPGIWVPCHGTSNGIFGRIYNNFDTFVGAGPVHAGKQFVLWNIGSYDSVLLEVSDTW